MKIFIANSSDQQYGGGFSFIDNFKKAVPEVTDNYDEADVYLIPSPTMVEREQVIKAKDDKKKVVLRIDNAVRNSRNRNTGMSRMYDFANWANLVVYQSQWARKYLMPYLGQDGVVIHNSVDTSIFNTFSRQNQDHPVYLYSRFNRDETKNWEAARYCFSQEYRRRPESELYIVGNFSPELVEGNFDFYNGERFKFWGVQPLEAIVSIYKMSNYLLYTYFNDACSNTCIESLCCGLKLVGDEYYRTTGGTPEIIERFEEPLNFKRGLEYFGLERMARQYKEAFRERLRV